MALLLMALVGCGSGPEEDSNGREGGDSPRVPTRLEDSVRVDAEIGAAAAKDGAFDVVYDLMSSRVKAVISRTEYVTLQTVCPSSGSSDDFVITKVDLLGPTVAEVTSGYANTDAVWVDTYVLEGGRWRLEAADLAELFARDGLRGAIESWQANGVQCDVQAANGYSSDDDSALSPWDCPSDKPIKGNRSFESGELIFHLPGWKYYDLTDPEDCFSTIEEAEAHGYRASLVQ